MNRSSRPIPVDQAIADAPTLAKLAALADASRARLDTVRHLIPHPLQSAVKAGPIDDGTWCLIVANSATAAKLRQLLPSLQAALQSRGHTVQQIRLKVQSPGP
ncbi:MAG: DUF721 domain-containing protein [Betaproteobacteria bacterium]|jgi:hypothetical protein|nr:DUF721 domain-containing protein [Betaproteobacteria bacterium]